MKIKRSPSRKQRYQNGITKLRIQYRAMARAKFDEDFLAYQEHMAQQIARVFCLPRALLGYVP